MGAQRGVADIAGLMRQLNMVGKKREGTWIALPLLAFKPRKIDRCAMKAGWRAGFHAPHLKPQGTQVLGQRIAGKFAGPAGLDAALGRAVGLDAQAFEAAWQSSWGERLGAVEFSLRLPATLLIIALTWAVMLPLLYRLSAVISATGSAGGRV